MLELIINERIAERVRSRASNTERAHGIVLYDEYSTGGAFDVPMQNTIRRINCSKYRVKL